MNKKEIKRFNKKLLVVFFVMVTIFATLLMGKAQARHVPAQIESKNRSTKGMGNGYLTYEDLRHYYHLLCNQHGGTLRRARAGVVSGMTSEGAFSIDVTDATVGKVYKIGDPIDQQLEDITALRSTTSAGGGIHSSTSDTEAYVMTKAYYRIVESCDTTKPDRAYLLAEMKKYGSGHPTELQNTWWSMGSTNVGKECKEFSRYMYDVTGTSSWDELKALYKEQSYSFREGNGGDYTVDFDVDPDGDTNEMYPGHLDGTDGAEETFDDQSASKPVEEGTGPLREGSIKAPDFEYNAYFYDVHDPDPNRRDVDKSGDVTEADEITTSFDPDKQQYIVGPFRVHYADYSVSLPGRNPAQFSGIYGASLKSNLDEELVFGTDWNFLWLENQGRNFEHDGKFPKSEEVFYITINHKDGMKYIESFKLDFRYMTAGAEYKELKGKGKIVRVVPDYDDETETVPDYEMQDTDGDGVEEQVQTGTHEEFVSRQRGLRVTSVTPYDAQTLVAVAKGVRWYKYTSLEKEYGEVNSSKIQINKITVGDETGEKIPVKRNYTFEIYLKRDGETDFETTPFQTLFIEVRNGTGSATSNEITWEALETPPEYKVVEVDVPEGTTNNGPWTGSLGDAVEDVVQVEAINYEKPEYGKLKIDKKILNSTPALESEVFKFKVTVTGKFGYDGDDITTQERTLELDVEITGAGEWISKEFRWYKDAPHYEVVEIIPEGAEYELESSSYTSGQLQGGIEEVKVLEPPATFTNKTNVKPTTIHIDKEMIGKTKPQPGEVFTVALAIKGKFGYDGDTIQDREMNFDIVLDQSNNWTWDSKEIRWFENEIEEKIPICTVKEINMATGTTNVTISDGIITSSTNNFEAKLKEKLMDITIVNAYKKKYVGKIKIDKLVESEECYGNSYTFEVVIKGKFVYYPKDADPIYSEEHGETMTLPVTITVDNTGKGSWKSDIICWEEDADTPTYTVEETNIPAEEFVSITNRIKTETSRHITPEDVLEGVKIEGHPTDPTIEVGQVIVTCINTKLGTEPKSGHIIIVKESENEALDNYAFYFRVTIESEDTFRYYDQVKPDGTPDFTTYEPGNKLVLEGRINGVKAICGGEDWVSELIEWDEAAKAPTYTVEEIDADVDYEFCYMSARDGQLVYAPKITRTLAEGTDRNVITAVNKPTQDHEEGSLIISKMVTDETSDEEIFYFDLEVKGEFTYGQKEYGPDSENGDTYELKDIEVKVGEPYHSEKFEWEKGKDAPIYIVKENISKLSEDYEFVSISNGRYLRTGTNYSGEPEDGIDPMTIEYGVSGHLNEKKPIQVTCNNTGGITNGTHIEITKKVLSAELKHKIFYFDVDVWSDSPFKYHDKEDNTKITEYNHGEHLTFRHVRVEADGEDWVSGYIEWEEGASKPYVKVSEVTSLFPDGVQTVSVQTPTELIFEKFSNTSGEDLTIEGELFGDVYHIIAINDEYAERTITITKKSTTEDLTGKPCKFTLKVTGEFDYDGKHYGAGSENGSTFVKDDIVAIANGNSWVSEEFNWKVSDGAPTYEVTETVLPEDSQFVSISNESQTCMDGSRTVHGTLDYNNPNVEVLATNRGIPRKEEGTLVVRKEVLNNALIGTEFLFDITVSSSSTFKCNGVEYGPGNPFTLTGVKIKGGSSYEPLNFEWDAGANIPTYVVTEHANDLPDGVKTVSIKNSSGTIIQSELDNTTGGELTINGPLQRGETVYVTATNKGGGNQGKVIIKKLADTELLVGEEFTFTLTLTGNPTFKYAGEDYSKLVINDIKIKASEPGTALRDMEGWVSDVIEWDDKAPDYQVTEEEATFADGVEFVSIRNAYQSNTEPIINGTVEPHFNNWIMAENTVKEPHKGKIQIRKELHDEKGNQIDGVSFNFNVIITHKDRDGNTLINDAGEEVVETIPAPVTSGGVWRSPWISWEYNESEPAYHVEEVENDQYNCTIDDPDGFLVAQDTENGVSGIVLVNADNEIPQEYEAQIRVNKLIEVDDKISLEDVTESFTAQVEVLGTFTYKGKLYNNEKLVIKILLNKESNWTWISDKITWAGDKAPLYTVNELEQYMPDAWSLKSISASGNVLEDGEIATVDITNEWLSRERIELVMRLGGKVWDDTDRTIDKHADSLENGIIDEGEAGISDVKVTVYRVLSDKETGETIRRLDENAFAVAYTDDTGNWGTEKIDVPAFTDAEKESGLYGSFNDEHEFVVSDNYIVTYDVEFEYDGQTYEPTTLLATAQENYPNVGDRWQAYVNSTTAERDAYLDNSDVIDNSEERIGFNEKFADIQGKTPIDDNGNTEGTTGSGATLHYSSVDTVSFFNSDHSRKVSTLETMDENNEIYQDLRMSSATSTAHLTYPFYVDDPYSDTSAWHLRSWDKILTTSARDPQDQDKILELEEELEELQRTVSEEEKRVTIARDSVDGIKKTIEDYEEQLRELEEELEKNIEQAVGGQRQEVQNLEEEVNNLRAEKETADAEAEEARAAADEAAEAVETASEEERAAAVVAAREAEQVARAKEAEVTRLERELTRAERNLESAKRRLESAINAVKRANISLVSSIEVIKKDVDREKGNLEAAEAELEDAIAAREAAEAEIAEEVARIQRELETYRTKIHLTTYKFEAIYNYCLSINLGLIEREATDLAVEKDLSEAIVVVNGKALKYKFNTAIDLEDPDYRELLYKQLSVQDSQIEYKIGLYKGDYYYRAAVYDETEAGDALESFYTTSLGLLFETSEMEIYLKYTINVYNQSETYDVAVGEIADYYDGTFQLITEPESRYIQTLNGKDVDRVVEIASPSEVKYSIIGNEDTVENGERIQWNEVTSYTGSDGVLYKKMTTSSLANKKLASYEKATITATFKITKDSIGESGVFNTIKLGEKHNVAEVTKFTSYYSKSSKNKWSEPGQISGRVDNDSAPDNINIQDHNEKEFYEDDTDSAPIITIGIEEEPRAVTGIVWDDAQTKSIGLGQVVGDGLYNPQQGDKLIHDATTEIYESITVPDPDGSLDGEETVYKEYQFAWPTETPIKELGGKTIAELTGFHQATTTNQGTYEFINMPAGNYKVRYVYGDKQIETGRTGSEEVYSGQDYKTTAYQYGFDNDRDNDGYIDNEWHDISNNKLKDLRVNDARDDEGRRLYISAKSEMLTFDNTSILTTADDKTVDHAELFGNYQDVRTTRPRKGDGYYMYAETAKINLGIENIYHIGYTTQTIEDIVELGEVYGDATINGKDVGTRDFTYNIKNIDCGIEERSPTKLTLDKQIKEITLMTSDNKVVLDAIYDIQYLQKADGTITSTVTLNREASTGIEHISSLNRRGAYDQGYRYIIAEGKMLQGAQIKIKYQLTVFNMSETDRISRDLESLWADVNAGGNIDGAMQKLSTPFYTERKGRVYNDGTEFTGVGYGIYFGSVYYLGSQGVGIRPDEVIVKTEVHQMIDYIDPDVEFKDVDNITRNQSWTNTEIEYLLENHLVDPATVQILKSDGSLTGQTAADREISGGERYSIISDKLQEYKTDTKNNLVLTIDNGKSNDNGSNPGFIKFLEPYMANNNKERSTGTIILNVSRFFSSELDANDIDNLAEIIKVENTAGRRDYRNIAGNANPYELDDSGNPLGIYAVAQGKEKDASATEVITLSPPTGLDATESRTTQLIIVVLISVTLVAVAIVIIKKKVLVK